MSPTVGGFDLRLRPVVLEQDLDRLHAWVTHPRSVYWEMQGASRDDVAEEYSQICSSDHHQAFIGLDGDQPQFLLERYDPRRGPLAGLSEIEEGDIGMHLLVAPTDHPRHGFTRAVMCAVMRFCLADPAVRRVVVEPDVRNEAIASLNAAAGFVVLRYLELPTKVAALSVATRESFADSDLESEHVT